MIAASKLRLVEERWYHRITDFFVRKKSVAKVPIGTVTFQVYVADSGKMFAEQSGIDVNISRGVISTNTPPPPSYL